MDSDTTLLRPFSELAQEATRVAIEALGNTAFERLYGFFDQRLQMSTTDLETRVHAAACIFIEATRKDSPSKDTQASGISMIWLGRNYPECLHLTTRELVNRMLPAYYDYRGQANLRLPHRGYLVYTPKGNGWRVDVNCTLYHPEEETQLIVHDRDDSLPYIVEHLEWVDHYLVHVQPGDRIQFSIRTGNTVEKQEAWFTVTTAGPVEEASRTSLWLVLLNQQDVPALSKGGNR